ALHRAEADLDRELAAVAAPAGEIEPDAHRPRARRVRIALAMSRVPGAETIGHQDLDLAPDQLARLVAEERHDLDVGEHDAAGTIDDHHRVGRGIEQTTKLPPQDFRLAEDFGRRMNELVGHCRSPLPRDESTP